jgi:DNA-directed RNA polymerase subunit RPC12/RpoP
MIYKCLVCGDILKKRLAEWDIRFCRCGKMGVDNRQDSYSRVIGAQKYIERVIK